MAIEFGLFPFGSALGMPSGEQILSDAQRAEELGFGVLWMGDHIQWRVPTFDTMAGVAVLAGRTRRIKIGTGVILVPLRPPGLLAKSAATLDYLSGGRFILGVGVGGENPVEFDLCGVPVRDRGRRTDETLAILRKLWADQPASHEGLVSFSEVDMRPKPAQPGGPPIWGGGRAEGARRRAGRYGDAWFGYFVSPERYRQMWATVQEHARAAGRDPDRLTPALHINVCLLDNPARAREQALAYLRSHYNATDERLVDRYCLIGPPEVCADKLRAFAATGVRHISFDIMAPPEGRTRMIERLAGQVLPQLSNEQ